MALVLLGLLYACVVLLSVFMARMHILVSLICPRCGTIDEDPHHILGMQDITHVWRMLHVNIQILNKTYELEMLDFSPDATVWETNSYLSLGDLEGYA